MHESPTTGLSLAKKKRGNGEEKDRDGRRRRYAGDEVNAYLEKQSASVSPVVIDLDPIRTPPSLPSLPSRKFDFDLKRIVDMDLNLDLLSEANWQQIPPPPNYLDGWIPPSSTSFPSSFLPSKSNDFGFNISYSSPSTLPFSLSTSTSSLPATFPASPSVNTTPRPRSPSPTLYSHYPTFSPILTPPPPPVPANTLDWDIDPARLEARRRRVAHLYGKFCRDGERDVGVGNVGV